jgi:hypothetical protein
MGLRELPRPYWGRVFWGRVRGLGFLRKRLRRQLGQIGGAIRFEDNSFAFPVLFVREGGLFILAADERANQGEVHQ